MASGIEVAGLVLAVLPLFISAAEHYKDGIGFVKRAIKKELFAAQYKEELTQQKSLLILYIKGIVGRTTLTPLTQESLVSNPTGDPWKRSEVVKQISTELGEAYQPFLDTISRICKALAKQIQDDTGATANHDDVVGFSPSIEGSITNRKMQIQQLQDLCLENSTTPSSTSKKNNVVDRIKFSWKSAQRAAILTELQACNTMLEKLINASDRAKPYARKQQSRRVHAAYEQREIIRRLFDILRNACNCTPAETRQVGLRLQVRADEFNDDPELNFQMIMFLSQGVICELSAKISKAEAEDPPKKKVRILGNSTQAAKSSSGTATKSLKIIEDICKEVSHAHACKSCLHLVVDKHEKVYCSALQQTSQARPQTVASKVLSLTDMMSKLEPYGRKRWLHREKSILAVILAYSLLQLHESPWSRSQWSSNDISFLENGLSGTTQPGVGVHLHLRRPYTRSQVTASAAAMASKPARRNAHLHALGVVLLELYLNRSIETDVVASGSNDFRAVAQDLLEDYSDDMTMTPEYLSAIRFCLSPKPNQYSGSYSFEDEGFREIYYEEVIAMLEENLTSRFEVPESAWLGE